MSTMPPTAATSQAKPSSPVLLVTQHSVPSGALPTGVLLSGEPFKNCPNAWANSCVIEMFQKELQGFPAAIVSRGEDSRIKVPRISQPSVVEARNSLEPVYLRIP
jgi:hypothetical protein